MMNLAAVCALVFGLASGPAILEPEIVETRTVTLVQTVTLSDIPAGSEQVRMWVPVPSDGAWQRVLDRKVVSAAGTWRVVRQAEGRGDFVYLELTKPEQSQAAVVVECTVQTRGVHFPIDPTIISAPLQPEQFEAALARDVPLMGVDQRIQKLADQICGNERDVARQATMLMQAVAAMADHYSKDPSKPRCGRGAASDCLDQGGGCCTDLHSLFIALARARGVPARMQYGYRLLDAKAGAEFDPGYRCWIEFFVPGAGWVPTDIVASDNADPSHSMRWASLSATRLWLWEGRSFQLTPPAQTQRIDTMLCGWAEIDGQPVDVLPGPQGAPSKLQRTVKFEVVKSEKLAGAARLPE